MPKKLSPPPEIAPLQLGNRLRPEWRLYFEQFLDAAAMHPIIIYRLNTDITGNDDPLGASGGEWEIADDTKLESKYGDTLVTELNGIFTFSETGYYYIDYSVLARGTDVDPNFVVRVEATDDNSAYSFISAVDMSIPLANYRSTASNRCLIKVEDVANDKIKIVAALLAAGTTIEGSTDYTETNIMFQKIADI